MAERIDIERLGALTGHVPPKPVRGRGFRNPKVVARAVKASVRTRKRKAAKRAAERNRKFERPEFRADGGNAKRMRYGMPGWQVLVCRMEPGAWYAFADLFVLMHEFKPGSVKAWSRQDMVRRGLIEKTPDPDWRPGKVRGDRGFDLRPRFLFRMTEKAARLRVAWQERLRMGAGC